MKQSQIVIWFFDPPNGQVPVVVEPEVGALDDPTAGAFAGLFRLFFLALTPDVGRVAVGGGDFAHLGRVIARVQAQVLLGPARRPHLSGGLHGEQRPTGTTCFPPASHCAGWPRPAPARWGYPGPRSASCA